MLDLESQRNIYRRTIKNGDVFLKKFNEADHEKFFIITGISGDKICVCSVFINSRIHPSILSKPQVVKLHIPLLKTKNEFLSHDSFANCSYPIPLNTSQIIDGIINKTCKVIGKVQDDDLLLIQNTLIESGLLTEEEINLYFK